MYIKEEVRENGCMVHWMTYIRGGPQPVEICKEVRSSACARPGCDHTTVHQVQAHSLLLQGLP